MDGESDHLSTAAKSGIPAATPTQSFLELDVYTSSQVLTGRISCPTGIRVIDFLNTQDASEEDLGDDFLALAEVSEAENSDRPKSYIRKASIQIAAIRDACVGRGIGASPDAKTYPFVCKTPKRVSLQMSAYELIGNIHLASKQTVRDVLNDHRLFLPLTDATITDDSGFRGERPFVAVNKRHIITLREYQFFQTS